MWPVVQGNTVYLTGKMWKKKLVKTLLVTYFNTYSLEFSGQSISLRPRVQFGWTGCLGFRQHQWSSSLCLTSAGITNVCLLLTFMEMLWVEFQLCACEYGQGYIFLLIALNFFCKKCISVNSSFTPLANTHRAKTMCCYFLDTHKFNN